MNHLEVSALIKSNLLPVEIKYKWMYFQLAFKFDATYVTPLQKGLLAKGLDAVATVIDVLTLLVAAA